MANLGMCNPKVTGSDVIMGASFTPLCLLIKHVNSVLAHKKGASPLAPTMAFLAVGSIYLQLNLDVANPYVTNSWISRSFSIPHFPSH